MSPVQDFFAVSHDGSMSGKFTYIWFSFKVNVGIVNISYMDPMGIYIYIYTYSMMHVGLHGFF